jgi:hypothetical protein
MVKILFVVLRDNRPFVSSSACAGLNVATSHGADGPVAEAGHDVGLNDVSVLARGRGLDPALAVSVAKPFLGRVGDRRAYDCEPRGEHCVARREERFERGLGALLREVAVGRRAADEPGRAESLLNLFPADACLQYHWGPALPRDEEHVAGGMGSLILHRSSPSYAVPPGVQAPRGRLLGQVDVDVYQSVSRVSPGGLFLGKNPNGGSGNCGRRHGIRRYPHGGHVANGTKEEPPRHLVGAHPRLDRRCAPGPQLAASALVMHRGVASSALALIVVLSGCGGGKLSKEQYESRVCDIMIRAANAWTTAEPQQTFADAADDLGSISAPADVEAFHETLASEMKEYSEILGGDGLEAIDHQHEWEKALSEIRAGGYNVKPGWGTCPAG